MLFLFAVWAGPRPRPNSKKKKKTNPPKQQKKKKEKKKKKTRPRPFRACFCFCCLGGWVCSFFAVWAGGVFFLLFGRGACSFFLLFGQGRVLFLLFGRGRVLFFAVWAGDVFCFFFCFLFGRGTGVHSLTRLPGSSLSDPTTKETEQQKKTRVPTNHSSTAHLQDNGWRRECRCWHRTLVPSFQEKQVWRSLPSNGDLPPPIVSRLRLPANLALWRLRLHSSQSGSFSK